MKLISIPFCAVLLALPLSAQGAETDDFENGINNAGWNFGVTVPDIIETSGGYPNGWLHNTQIDMFAVILRTQTTTGPWVGDYRAQGVSRIHFDAQTINAMTAGGRQMSVLLRDTKGTPADPNDDDYAYTVGSLIPQIGQGWKHFNFEIPSQSTEAVPPGWSGGWAGNLNAFRPGVDWNDVITNVDVVEIWWMDPSFFAIFQTWNVGVDNMSIEWDSHAELSIAPATAGTLNTLTMTNASPYSDVRFAGSVTPGSWGFQCNGFQTALSMSSPTLLGAATADNRGIANLDFQVPATLSGRTVYLQDVDECRLTAPLSLVLL